MPPGVNPGGSFCRNISQLPSRDANLVTTQTWGVTQRYIYSPYGSMILLNADFSTPPSGTQPISDYLYQGMALDAVTGLYYARNRNHSPSLGVWILQDPLQYVNGANTYQMEMSGPVGSVDPGGRSTLPARGIPLPAGTIGIFGGTASSYTTIDYNNNIEMTTINSAGASDSQIYRYTDGQWVVPPPPSVSAALAATAAPVIWTLHDIANAFHNIFWGLRKFWDADTSCHVSPAHNTDGDSLNQTDWTDPFTVSVR